MILIDAYAVLALALDEPAAGDVDVLLRENLSGAAITSVNLVEVVDHLVRQAGWPEADVRVEVALLLREALRVLDVGADIAWRAGLLRARYCARGDCDVSLADCILLASAGTDDRLATSDPSVALVARAEGIELLPLPDSLGRRP